MKWWQKATPFIAWTDKSLFPWHRTTGVYGHWPRNGYVGYITVLTKRYGYNFFYGGRNPYRPGKVVERFEVTPWEPSPYQNRRPLTRKEARELRW